MWFRLPSILFWRTVPVHPIIISWWLIGLVLSLVKSLPLFEQLSEIIFVFLIWSFHVLFGKSGVCSASMAREDIFVRVRIIWLSSGILYFIILPFVLSLREFHIRINIQFLNVPYWFLFQFLLNMPKYLVVSFVTELAFFGNASRPISLKLSQTQNNIFSWLSGLILNFQPS